MKKYTIFGICSLVLLLSALSMYGQGFTGSSPAPQINSVRALQIAQTRAPAAGTLISMEWELKRAGSEWSVTIIHGQMRYSVKINGDSGQIISYSERQYTPRQPLTSQPPANRVSFETIRQNALSIHPGWLIEEIDYGHKHGRWVYEVELRPTHGRKSKIYFDAVTGTQLQLSPGRNVRTWS